MCFSADGYGGIFWSHFQHYCRWPGDLLLVIVAGAVVHKRLNLTPRGKSQRSGGNHFRRNGETWPTTVTWPAPRGRDMQLQQIKYFLVLHEELSFTRAARAAVFPSHLSPGASKGWKQNSAAHCSPASRKYRPPVSVVRWRHISSGSSKTRKMHSTPRCGAQEAGQGTTAARSEARVA